MRASILSAGLVPVVVMLLAGISATAAQRGAHRLGVVDHRRGDAYAGHFKVLGPRVATYGEPSDYGYYPPPYGEDTKTTSAATTTKSGAFRNAVVGFYAAVIEHVHGEALTQPVDREWNRSLDRDIHHGWADGDRASIGIFHSTDLLGHFHRRTWLVCPGDSSAFQLFGGTLYKFDPDLCDYQTYRDWYHFVTSSVQHAVLSHKRPAVVKRPVNCYFDLSIHELVCGHSYRRSLEWPWDRVLPIGQHCRGYTVVDPDFTRHRVTTGIHHPAKHFSFASDRQPDLSYPEHHHQRYGISSDSSSVVVSVTYVSSGASTSQVGNDTVVSSVTLSPQTSVSVRATSSSSTRPTGTGYSSLTPSGEIQSSSARTRTESASWVNTTSTQAETATQTSAQLTVSTISSTLNFTTIVQTLTGTVSSGSAAWSSTTRTGNATSTASNLESTTGSQLPWNTTAASRTSFGTATTVTSGPGSADSTATSRPAGTAVTVTVTTTGGGVSTPGNSAGSTSTEAVPTNSNGTTQTATGSRPPFSNTTSSSWPSGQTVTTTIWNTTPTVSRSVISSHSVPFSWNPSQTGTHGTPRPPVTPFNTTWLSWTSAPTKAPGSSSPPFPTTRNSTETLSGIVTSSPGGSGPATTSVVTITLSPLPATNSTSGLLSKSSSSIGSLSWSLTNSFNLSTIWFTTGAPTGSPSSSPIIVTVTESSTGSPAGTVSSVPLSTWSVTPPFLNSSTRWSGSTSLSSASSSASSSWTNASQIPTSSTSALGTAASSSSGAVSPIVNSTTTITDETTLGDSLSSRQHHNHSHWQWDDANSDNRIGSPVVDNLGIVRGRHLVKVGIRQRAHLD
ncbi:muc1-extracellular alpha-1 [Trichoderma cornu-damae]|uniref:Muc1-extracellular alpha-1 n=1 Tax=Trichoderma cornu-damae TaxID=654480 RepID=A0A9P8QLX2_9HYPO|nr:muc1-extracellular alpha-1 [Trichoderma cornu-damae]